MNYYLIQDNLKLSIGICWIIMIAVLNIMECIYKIILDGSHYEIKAETYNNRILYIKVKTTKYELGRNKIPFFS